MPIITGESIERIARGVLRAAGATDEHAKTVAQHLADANLAGHDSHGLIRVPPYVRGIKEGRIDPVAQSEVVGEHMAMAQVNGNATFGQVVAAFATRLAMNKAREYGIGLVAMYNLGHTGRIGSYPEMAAKEGMAAIMYSGGITRGGGGVAPFGGREGRLSTNPISMAFPSSSNGVILLDFATSMAAEGKIRVYSARGQALPDQWVLSKDGVPSNDPNDYYDGGAILPVGGLSGGHKGYALSFMVVLLGGMLGGLGRASNLELAPPGGGTSIIVIDLESLAPIDDVKAQVEELVRFVKDTPPMEGSSGVLYPGEVEARSRQERRANGVPVEQPTWEAVAKLIKEYGLEDELAPLP
jgi:uncharacterized oxidoreductase